MQMARMENRFQIISSQKVMLQKRNMTLKKAKHSSEKKVNTPTYTLTN